MNEMNTNGSNKGETRMKKTLIIMALAMVLIFALGATPAFAKYAGYNAATQYVSWTAAQELASQNTDAALMARGPHAGYATTTIKCAVCHSVHRGGTALLNEGSSCAYCHTPASWGGGAVASNLISWYAGGTTASGLTAAGGPHSSRCANDDCHGGPHGVGASVYDGPASKLLTAKADVKLLSDTVANGLVAGDLASYDAETRALATGAVCSRSGCHVDSVFGVIASGSKMAAEIDSASGAAATMGGITGELVTGHRVIAAATSNWNDRDNNNVADNVGFTAAKTGTIAYAGVDYCSSCHDLADDNNAGKAAFPHAINGVVDSAVGYDGLTHRPAVWLTAGDFAGAAGTRIAVSAYNDYNAAAPAAGAAGGGIIDGVCLKCHRGSASTGVGFTF
jgi:hypothetical protein